MRMNLIAATLVCALFTFTSCQKDASNAGAPAPAPTGGTQLFRIQRGTDHNLGNDTVWSLAYNSIGKVASIADSISHENIMATYDASLRVSEIKNSHGDFASFTYNINGLLSEIKVKWASQNDRYVFSYNDNVIAKKSFYTDGGTGGQQYLFREYEYAYINGNITSIKEYSPTHELLRTETCTFGIQVNAFKDLGLFSYALLLRADHVIDPETYFNKNLLSAATISEAGKSNSDQLLNTYTLNGMQSPLKVITKVGSESFTWIFSYQ
jgi:hypothetical protein